MEGTILEVLTQRNPRLNLTLQKPGGVTQNTKYINLDRDGVSTSTWDDFNYENVVAALGHLLDYGAVNSMATDDVKDSQTQINKEEDIDRLGDHWFTEVVYEPLKYGTVQTLKQLGVEETNVSFRLKGVELNNPVEDSRLNPDWWIYQHTKPETTIVVGDSKCSSKWCSNIAKSPAKGRAWLWPMRQVGSYCKYGKTRYAFIITPEELVAARFYTDKEDGNANRVEFKSIPWEAGAPNELTMNLAIWALAIFALNEGHRPVMDRSETLPLNVWWKDRDEAGAVSYEHHLTGRKMTSLPPGGEARQRPTHIPGFVAEERVENGSAGNRTSKRKRRMKELVKNDSTKDRRSIRKCRSRI